MGDSGRNPHGGTPHHQCSIGILPFDTSNGLEFARGIFGSSDRRSFVFIGEIGLPRRNPLAIEQHGPFHHHTAELASYRSGQIRTLYFQSPIIRRTIISLTTAADSMLLPTQKKKILFYPVKGVEPGPFHNQAR